LKPININTGTEKQIAFAEKLKTQAIEYFTRKLVETEKTFAAISDWEEYSDLNPALLIDLDVCSLASSFKQGGLVPESHQQVLATLRHFLKWLDAQINAKWWIDHGQFAKSYLLIRFLKNTISKKA
jgi:hypothetical protein